MSSIKKTANAVKILHNRYVEDKPGRKASLQEERVNAQVARLIFSLRKDAGLSQKQLAEMIDTTQSVISRLEDADYEGHSLSVLEKITSALNKRLIIEAVDVSPEATSVRQG